MLAEEIRCAVMAAPRTTLAEISSVLWRAFAAGAVDETQAGELSSLIEARKALPRPASVTKARRGARPRRPEHVELRRRWAASGWLPPAVAARFTPAETAVLSVVAWQVAKHGRCVMPIGRIASLAGTGKTKVKDAIRLARSLGLISVEERRMSAMRNDTNVLRVVDRDWTGWLTVARRRAGMGGVGNATCSNTKDRRDCASIPGLRSGFRAKGLPTLGATSASRARGMDRPGFDLAG